MDNSDLVESLQRFSGLKRKRLHTGNATYSEQYANTVEKEFNANEFPFLERNLEQYLDHSICCEISDDILVKTLQEPDDFVEYKHCLDPNNKANHKALGALFSFIRCAEWCKIRLKEALQTYGWSVNITNVDPIARSHNIPELLTNTQHCILGAIHLRLKLNHYLRQHPSHSIG